MGECMRCVGCAGGSALGGSVPSARLTRWRGITYTDLMTCTSFLEDCSVHLIIWIVLRSNPRRGSAGAYIPSVFVTCVA